MAALIARKSGRHLSSAARFPSRIFGPLVYCGVRGTPGVAASFSVGAAGGIGWAIGAGVAGGWGGCASDPKGCCAGCIVLPFPCNC
jgi:hypothetical protein